MKGTIGPSRAASARLIARAVAVEPVKATPAVRRSATSAAPTVSPAPGHEDQRVCGNARLVQELHRAIRDERRLLGGLRDHRVAGGERGGDLSHEDRQRKVPRADADEGTASRELQAIGFARRAR